MSYTVCPSCGASDGQGCYSDCPTILLRRVAELEKEVSARRGAAEAITPNNAFERAISLEELFNALKMINLS